MNENILLIGGGGHCKSVLDSLLKLNRFKKIGIIDKKENLGSSVLGVPIIGCDDDLGSLFNEGYKYAFVSVGSIGDSSLRIKIFNLINDFGYDIPVIIDDSAVVSRNTVIEKGVYIGKNSIINAGACIKKGSIINSGSIIEHDCNIGSFSHIAPGAVLGGEVNIGDNTHVGLNTTIKQQVSIGSNSIIGMGSVVLKNIGDRVLAYGNPCQEVKEIECIHNCGSWCKP